MTEGSFFKKLFVFGLIASIGLMSVQSSVLAASQPKTLTVFAAASLTDAFKEIGKKFETAHPDIVVTFNFGGSQNLRAQLEQGAIADVFASANQKEMEAAVAASLVNSGTEKSF